MDAAFFRRRLAEMRAQGGAPSEVAEELETALAWLVPDAGHTPSLRHVRGLSKQAHELFIALLDEAIAHPPVAPAASEFDGTARGLTVVAAHGDTVYAYALSEAAPHAASASGPGRTQPVEADTGSSSDAAAFLTFEADRFKRRYDLLEVVGHGTFGQVLRARDRYLQREVALKRLNLASLRTSGDGARRLFRYSLLLEARVGAQLVHPNLVPIHDFGFDGEGNPYLVMRYLEGGATLRELLQARNAGRTTARRETASREALLKVLIKVCDGLSFAHAHGVVHRDVKPENIYIADFDDVTVLDWGIARLLDKTGLDLAEFSALLGESPQGRGVAATAAQAAQAAPDQRSLFGGRVGTPAYMAPEQARAENSAVDARTDVWALGVILYEVLTGVRPFGESKQQGVLDRVLDGSFELPSRYVERTLTEAKRHGAGNGNHTGAARRAGSDDASGAAAVNGRVGADALASDWLPERVPPELDRIVGRALAYRSEERYPSLVEMRHDLEAFLTHRPLEDASPWEVLRKWAGRNRVTVTAVTLLVLLLASTLIAGVTRYVQDVAAERREVALQRAETERHALDAQREREAAQASRDDAELMLADAALYRGRSLVGLGHWVQAKRNFAEAQRILARRDHDNAAVAALGLWDTARLAPEPVQQFQLPGGGTPQALHLATDGWRMLSVEAGGEAHVFDAAQGTPLEPPQVWPKAPEAGWLVQPAPVVERLRPGAFLIASADGTLRLMTLAGEEPPGEVRLPGAELGAVLATASRPASQREIWVGTAGGTLVRWNLRDGYEVQRIAQAHAGAVFALAWHEASATLFSLGADNTLAAWKLDETAPGNHDTAEPFEPSWRVTLPHAATPGALAVVEVAPGAARPGLRVVAGTEEYAEAYDAETGEEVDTLYTHRTGVRTVAAAELGHVYVVTDGHLELLSLNRRTPRLLDEFALPADAATVALEPEAGLLLAGFAEGRVAVYSLGVHGGVQVRTGHRAPVTALASDEALAGGGANEARLMLSGDADGVVQVWDVLTGRLLREFRHAGGRVLAAGFAADGRSAVTAAVHEVRRETTLRQFDLLAGADLERITLDHDVSPLLPVAQGVSPDGRRVLLHRPPAPGETHDLDATPAQPGLYLWHVGGSRVPQPVPRSVGVEAPGRTVAFAEQGRMLVQLDAHTQTLRRWRLAGESVVPLSPEPLVELYDSPQSLTLNAAGTRLYVSYRHAARLDIFAREPATRTWQRTAHLHGEHAERLGEMIVLGESSSWPHLLTLSGNEASAALWHFDEGAEFDSPRYVFSTRPSMPKTVLPLQSAPTETSRFAFGSDSGLVQIWKLELREGAGGSGHGQGFANDRIGNRGDGHVDLRQRGKSYAAQGAWTFAHRCFEESRQRGDAVPPALAARAAWVAKAPEAVADARSRMSESEVDELAHRLLWHSLASEE